MKNRHSKQKGFTLIEMLIAMSIFVMIVIIVVNVYIVITNSQRKTIATQRVLDDVRYLLDAVAQNVRLSTIDYSFYESKTIDLHPLITDDDYVLALVNQAQQLVLFRRSSGAPGANDGLGDKVQYCMEETPGICDLADESVWTNITPASVQITDLRFIITPSANPFETATAVNCTGDSAKANECATVYGYSCPDAVDCVGQCTCEYFTDGNNFQPRVRIVIEARSDDIRLLEVSRTIPMQTTVSSRILQGEVVNTNY